MVIRSILLALLVLDVVTPFLAAYIMIWLVRRSWRAWKAYGLVSMVFTIWVLIIMHVVGYNVTSYLVILPIAAISSSIGVQVRDPFGLSLLILSTWVVIPAAMLWLLSHLREAARRVERSSPSPPA